VLPYLGTARNQVYGPGYQRINMSVFKNFPTFESQYLQVRADIFNLSTLRHSASRVTAVQTTIPRAAKSSIRALSANSPPTRASSSSRRSTTSSHVLKTICNLSLPHLLRSGGAPFLQDFFPNKLLKRE
jgi:hypothetical protein